MSWSAEDALKLVIRAVSLGIYGLCIGIQYREKKGGLSCICVFAGSFRYNVSL